MSKRLKKAGRQTVSVFLTTTTTLWLAGASFLMPAAVHAQTVEELQAQIDALMVTITQLQATIASLGGSSSGFSHVWAVDLSQGTTNADVTALQEALDMQGCFDYTSYTGYYGPITAAGVTCFQEKYASEVLTPLGLLAGTGYFGPSSRTKLNALYSVPVGDDDADDDDDDVVADDDDDTAVAGSGLTVAACDDQPTASLAPQNAINVPYTCAAFTASSDGDVVVDSTTIERTGLGNDSPYSGVVLLDENGNRINQIAKTLNSSHQAVINTDFTVEAGQTREVTVAADIGSSVASYAGQLAYMSVVAVNTDADLTATLPITGVAQTVSATVTIGGVTLSDGSLDPGTSRSKAVGATGYVFTSLKATVNSVEDVLWKSIAFNQAGSAAQDDLANIVVEDGDGNSYEATVSSDGKYYTANLGTGIEIKKGKNAEVHIRGDITGGSSRTVDFDLYRYEDVIMTGLSNGYDIKPSATEVAASADDGDFHSTSPNYDAYQVTISTGSLTVSKSNEVGSADFAPSTDQADLGAFEFEAKGEAVSFSSWIFTVTTTDNDSGGENGTLTNVTVYDENGSVVAGPQDADTKGDNVTFTDSITAPVGKNIYTIKGDLNSSWETSDTIVFSFTPSTAVTSVTGDNTGNTITPSPASAVTGPTITVKAAALTIRPSASFASSTVIKTSQNIEVGKFILDSTASGDDLKITVAKFRKDTNAGDSLANIRLRDGGSSTDTILNGNSSNDVTLTDTKGESLTFNLDTVYTMSKGTTKIWSLWADVSSVATGDSWYKFDVTGSQAWTVKDTDGSDVSESTSSTDAKGVTIQASGGFKVAAQSVVPVNTEQWVYGGQTGVTLNILKFTATSEDMALTNLRLQLDTTGSSSESDYAAVEIYAEGSLVQRVPSPFNENGILDLTFDETGDNSFVIGKDSSKLMTIKADLAEIGVSKSGTAGQLLGIDYDGAGGKAANDKTKAKGQSSGDTVRSSTDSDVAGNGARMFASVPQVRLCNDSQGPCTTLTDDASETEQPLIRFAVKALGGDIYLNRVTFLVSTSGTTDMATQLPSFKLWSVTNGDYVTNATGNAASLAEDLMVKNYDDAGNLILRMVVDESTNYSNYYYPISGGYEHVFELIGTIRDDATLGGSITVKLLGESGAADPEIVALTGSSAVLMAKVNFIDNEQRCGSPADAGSLWTSMDCVWEPSPSSPASSTAFIWSDVSAEKTDVAGTTTSLTSDDWMNGYKVPGLPS
ncbi:hypothetical protein ACFL3E_02485, partial [Patescibacteria group bacterium]